MQYVCEVVYLFGCMILLLLPTIMNSVLEWFKVNWLSAMQVDTFSKSWLRFSTITLIFSLDVSTWVSSANTYQHLFALSIEADHCCILGKKRPYFETISDFC